MKQTDAIPAQDEIAIAVTIAEALKKADAEINPIDARILLRHTLQANRAHLAAHPEKKLNSAQQAQFYSFVARRRKGEPVAYIIGEREFFGLTFKVTPAVLIPRPETEMLVEQALMRLSEHRSMRVLELGTGSGAIAVSIAQHRAFARIIATDLSNEALNIAKQNAQNILPGHAAALHFLQSDWYRSVPEEPFDLIVSNPPYIAENDPHLARGDLRFEPQYALAAGPHGLSALAHIARNAASRLAPGGWLILEHGYDQGRACCALLDDNGFTDTQTLQDLAGLDRVTLGQRPIGLK